MNVECMLVGRPGSGRSSLLTALLRSWGCRSLPVTTWYPGGSPSRWRLRLPEEERKLHRLRPPAGFLAVELAAAPLGLPGRRWTLVETPGIEEEVAGDEVARQGVAEALARLLAADLVVHVVDGAATGDRGWVAAADVALWRLARQWRRYLLVVSRMDCASALAGLALVRQLDPEAALVPVSALTGRGVRQLRSWLARIT